MSRVRMTRCPRVASKISNARSRLLTPPPIGIVIAQFRLPDLGILNLVVHPMLLSVRQAVAADVPALQSLIRESVLALQAGDYTPQQLELALERVFGVDTQLIQDGTYFVAEAQVGEEKALAGCGGWSKRRTLYGSDHCAGREDALLDPQQEAAKIRAFFVHPA